MKYGKYYVDDMPVGDETDDTYCVVYDKDPNKNEAAEEVDNFTITEDEEKAYGSLDEAIEAYMRRYHPNNTQKDKKRYQRLLLRKQQVQNDMLAMILNLLSRHGNRINSYPVPDEDGCVEYPVSMTLYGKHNDPMISVTSVYLDDANLLKADGVNESKCTTECGFVLYPEHYSWTLDFIAIALGYETQSE